jgi:Fic family protein
MSDLEKYIHSSEFADLPLIIQLALVHYQFETIHPFPDGNGRIGRLLIPLILAEKGQMSHPMLYISTYVERNYDRYIDLMYEVSRSGAWLDWIAFFIETIEACCVEAIKKAKAIQDLYAEYRAKIQTARSSALLAKIVDDLFNIPAITIPMVQKHLDISYNAAKNNVDKLVECGILQRELSESRPTWFFAFGIISVSNREEE